MTPFDNLWAPWRIEFLEAEKGEGCFLCRKAGEDRDEENLVLLRSKQTFVLLNRYPYTNGHLMVAPYAHEGRLTELDPSVLQEMMVLVQRSMRVLEHTLHPSGYNLGINQGRAAGAGLEEHLHLHIVPRWLGDTNFMPVLAGARTLPEALTETLGRLRQALKEVEGRA